MTEQARGIRRLRPPLGALPGAELAAGKLLADLRNRDTLLAGTVLGVKTERIGEAPYPYIALEEIHAWKETRRTLLEGADRLTEFAGRTISGARLNALGALRWDEGPPMPDTTPAPAATSELTSRVLGLSVELSWKDDEDGTVGFHVERREGAEPAFRTLPPGMVVYKDEQVQVSTQYVYRVRAVRGEAFSAYSNAGRSACFLEVLRAGGERDAHPLVASLLLAGAAVLRRSSPARG
jgi:hypothetical protein